MLSAENQIVYDILREITGDDEVYKIIDADEIIEKLPAEEQLTKVQLSQIIRDLKDREYVDIKYFTPDEYCMRVLKRIDDIVKQSDSNDGEAKPLPDSGNKSKERQLYGERGQKSVRPGLVLFMSFIGGILGSGFVAAITTLVLKFAI